MVCVFLLFVLVMVLVFIGCVFRVDYGDVQVCEMVIVDFGFIDLQMIVIKMVDDMMVFLLIVEMICDCCLVLFVDCIKNKISEYIDIEFVIDIIQFKLINFGKFCFVDMFVVDWVCE